jgi:hypothetical protein
MIIAKSSSNQQHAPKAEDTYVESIDVAKHCDRYAVALFITLIFLYNYSTCSIFIAQFPVGLMHRIE